MAEVLERTEPYILAESIAFLFSKTEAGIEKEVTKLMRLPYSKLEAIYIEFFEKGRME
ncbi:hypothetical protein [Listeria booriae]|uniref:Uncharacterized protein n=1 Tax=Listeria booriae TaxID=1552123 RepID=A0A842F4I1_9LIST|nr:hypothetical protein [Listeria booriae]MBC2242255.1 hypothetical protein [Listeria booriae]